MDKSDRKRRKNLIIIVILAIAVLIMVVVLLAIPYLRGEKKFVSKEHGYTVIYDSSVLQYERVCLNDADGINMDRFYDIAENGKFYFAVTDISPEVNLEEELRLLEEDENYDFVFVREQNISYGKGGYTAQRISYTDENGTAPVQITYYYDEDNGLMITICTDEKHGSIYDNMLASVTITK